MNPQTILESARRVRDAIEYDTKCHANPGLSVHAALAAQAARDDAIRRAARLDPVFSWERFSEDPRGYLVRVRELARNRK